MVELAVIFIGVALLLDLRHGWRSEGISNHAMHVLLFMLAGSALMTYAGWEHRRDWMGVTLVLVALPGLVAGWVIVKKIEEGVKDYRGRRR